MSSHVQPQKTRRWVRRKRERPGEILDAAVSVFAEKGFAAARMDDIAARAGVTKGTIYLYFRSKEEVFKSLVRGSIGETIEASADDARRFGGSARQRLLIVLQMIAKFAISSDRVVLPRTIIAEAGNFPELARFYRQEVVDRGLALLAGIIDEGVQRGEFRRLPGEHVARLCIAPILFVVLWRTTFARFDSQPFDFALLFETHIDVLLKGLTLEGHSP